MTNPFPGPRPYRTPDRDTFFGRSDMAQHLFRTILSNRSVMVYGPSGAGKSSLLQAAVLPMLVERHDARVISLDAWPDNENPTKWLAREVYTALGFGDVPSGDSPTQAIVRAIRAASRASSRPLVFVLDQIEQLLFPGRHAQETQPFFECIEDLIQMPQRPLRIVVSLREDYLGRFRDRFRDLRRIRENSFRIGPLKVQELVDAVIQAAAAGHPPQTWSEEEMRPLMLQVRAPGEASTYEAEAQSAYAQIICRTLFQERAAGKTIDVTAAEAILHGYLESTLAGLGPLRTRAQHILENHLIGSDGSRTLRTEAELSGVVTGQELAQILKHLEQSAILQAEEHHGSRYFEIGHDWLARRVFKVRRTREQEEAARKHEEDRRAALAKERAETQRRLDAARRKWRIAATIAAVALVFGIVDGILLVWALEQRALADAAREAANASEAKAHAKAIEASDARLLAGFRELRARGDVANGLRLLQFVEHPEQARGWTALANEGLLSARRDTTLRGATTTLTMAAWSHDGTRIAAASDYLDVWIWNANGLGNPQSRRIHENAVMSIAWSNDDKRLLTASADGKACLFEPYGKDTPVCVNPHVGLLQQAIFSPDNQRFAVLATDKIARVWRSDGTDPLELGDHTEPLTSLAFMPDGEAIVTASADKTARIVFLNGQRPSIVFRGHRASVTSAKPSPDGKYIVTTSEDDTARLWLVAKPGTARTLAGHRDAVIHAAWSPDGTRFVTSSRDKTARIWSVDASIESIVLSAPHTTMAAAAFRPDGRYVLTRSFEQTIAVWPTSGGAPIILEAPRGVVARSSWSPDGLRIATTSALPRDAGTADKTVTIWLVNHLDTLARVQKPFFHSPAIFADGQRFAAAFDDSTARISQLDGSGNPIVFRGHEGWVTSAVPSADGKKILTTSLDKTGRVWNSNGEGTPVVLRGAEHAVRGGAFDPHGRRVILVADDKKARIYDVASGRLERELSGHTDILTSAAWSHDGRFVATTSMDHSIRVWPIATQDPPIELRGHTGAVVALAWSPNDTQLVSASEDFTARVWEVATQKTIASMGHDSPLLAVAWSPEKNVVATSSVTRGLRLWRRETFDEPQEFIVDSHVVALRFIDEGRRIVTISENGSTRTLGLDVRMLKDEIAASNRDCMPVDLRVTHLGETLDIAESAFVTCERLAGRTSSGTPP